MCRSSNQKTQLIHETSSYNYKLPVNVVGNQKEPQSQDLFFSGSAGKLLEYCDTPARLARRMLTAQRPSTKTGARPGCYYLPKHAPESSSNKQNDR